MVLNKISSEQSAADDRARQAELKAKEEETLNEVPKITLVETTDKIISQQQQAQGEKEKKEIDALNEDYNLKDGERKKLISEYYSKHLSEILPEFLYLSSYNAAKNKDLLERNRITHIINCAQDYCENCFEKESNIQYLSLYLKDHALENVECTFYECIEFIEMVKQKEGRVLVHCIQGISRSVSIVIAYLIYKNKMTYDQAFNFVQSKRTISCPNFGFSIQLQNFYLRLFEAPEKYRFNPKIFAVGSFQLEQSEKIVCRLMNENFFKERESKDPRVFDKRGIFIIIGTNYLYIWIGKKVSPKMKTLYISAAEKYISLLRKYEHVSNKQIIYINEDEETEEFLKNLLKSEESIKKFKGKMSNEYSEWNNWYKEVEPKSQNSNIKKEEEESKGQSGEVLKAFFLYPELNPDKILDLEDLNDNLFLIACVKDPNEDKKTIFKWKGTGVELTEDECIEFQNKVTEKFFGSKSTEGINIIEEVPMEESEEFVALL